MSSGVNAVVRLLIGGCMIGTDASHDPLAEVHVPSMCTDPADYMEGCMFPGALNYDKNLLSRLLEQPFFEDLRTRQQLGYIVGSSVTENAGVRALVLTVQSAVQPPPELEKRIAAFLRAYLS